MLSVKLEGRSGGLRILYLGAHCDDIEIGCGGTIMRLNEEYTTQHVKWVVFTSTDKRAEEARKGADYFLQKCNKKEVVIKNFRDSFLPYEGEKVKNVFEELKSFNPDIVFTHCRHDRHLGISEIQIVLFLWKRPLPKRKLRRLWKYMARKRASSGLIRRRFFLSCASVDWNRLLKHDIVRLFIRTNLLSDGMKKYDFSRNKT